MPPALPPRGRTFADLLAARHASVAIVAACAALAWMPPRLAAQSGSLGHAVAFVASQLMVAEPTTSFRPGSVHLYGELGGAWKVGGALHAPDAERADGFGTLLAGDDGTLFVGQRGGPLHIFERSETGEWRHGATIEDDAIAGLVPGCRFDGYCGTDFGVSIAASGGWLLVGVTRRGGESANGGEDDEEAPGVVYMYRRMESGNWARHGVIQPADGVGGDRFGATLAPSGDGLLVGSPGWTPPDADAEGAGRVHHYRHDGGEWTEVQEIADATEAGAGFGAAMAVSGDRLLVGAPGADGSRGRVFNYAWSSEESRWTSSGEPLALAAAEEGDRFGAAVAFAGHDIWVGAPTGRGYETGSVFVYEGGEDGLRSSAPRRIRLPPSETVGSDRFGASITAGAGVVAVTAPGMHHRAGSVHLFGRDEGGAWGSLATLASEPDALSTSLAEGPHSCSDGWIGPFACDGVALLAHLSTAQLRDGDRGRGVRTNDNWGWTDPETGHEYAIVGRNDGTSFVDVTDPTAPVLVADLPRTPGTPPSQLWRDIKTYRDHAFIVADGAGEHGMQVFDLTRLRDLPASRMPALVEPDAHYAEVASAHNIVIDEETGFAYAVGSRGGGEACGGGLHVIDIREPTRPSFVGCGSDESIHDSQCVVYRGPDERYRGREICLNSNGDILEIVDVTDKEDPATLSSGSSSSPAYIHQGWLTPDHRYFYQNDEADVIAGSAATTRTLIWELSDVEDPVLVREFMGSEPASAHNLYVKDDLMYQANYLRGLHVLDISDRENPREVAHFDTAPFDEGPGFGGAWSNYPYFESGTVIVTSMQEGLFILRTELEGAEASAAAEEGAQAPG